MNTRVEFIELKRAEKARHLCELAEQFYTQGMRVLVTVDDDNQGVTLDRFMWTWKRAAFLPHSYDNGAVDCLEEPVVITTKEHNPNGATVLVMGDPCSVEFMAQFPQVIAFAETYEPELREASRERFIEYREAGFGPVLRK